MKNIAIALDAGMPLERNEITKFITSKGWAYWHWVDDFWIVQVPNDYSPKLLHEMICTLPGIGMPTILLFEFNGAINYWGNTHKDAWEWLSNIGKVSN